MTPTNPPRIFSLSFEPYFFSFQTLLPLNFLHISFLLLYILLTLRLLFGGFLLCRQKRVRFPKGKKVKPGDEVNVETGRAKDDDPSGRIAEAARIAAKERAKGRSKITAELFTEKSTEILHDISAAEVNYEVCFLKYAFPNYYFCNLVIVFVYVNAISQSREVV